jgi:hypothetical protein
MPLAILCQKLISGNLFQESLQELSSLIESEGLTIVTPDTILRNTGLLYYRLENISVYPSLLEP